MNGGLISASLPFAKKKALEILKADLQLARGRRAEDPGGLRQVLPGKLSGRLVRSGSPRSTASAAAGAGDIYDRNIFPDMNVTWGKYPLNIGHTDFPGCFRCHDGGHSAKDGKSITQDCNACHNLLAMDEANPKVLTDLGITEAKAPGSK